MSTDQVSVAMAGVLDALTLVQEQLDALAESGQRIEATHREIVHRLDTIDAGQAAVTDLTPILEMILGRSIDDREIMKTQLGTIAAAIGFAHAAANGIRAPLPVAVASDPLLERFILTQPADLLSDERSLTDWRNAASAASTAELIVLLNRQYQPSPTDTPETRVLRYRLAALTRAEIKGRGGRGAGTTKHRRRGRSDSLGLHDPVPRTRRAMASRGKRSALRRTRTGGRHRYLRRCRAQAGACGW